MPVTTAIIADREFVNIRETVKKSEIGREYIIFWGLILEIIRMTENIRKSAE